MRNMILRQLPGNLAQETRGGPACNMLKTTIPPIWPPTRRTQGRTTKAPTCWASIYDLAFRLTRKAAPGPSREAAGSIRRRTGIQAGDLTTSSPRNTKKSELATVEYRRKEQRLRTIAGMKTESTFHMTKSRLDSGVWRGVSRVLFSFPPATECAAMITEIMSGMIRKKGMIV